MAKSQKPNPPAASADPFSPVERESLDEILTGLPEEGVKVCVWEVTKEGDSYVKTFDGSPDFMDMIGRLYGPGKYKWRLRRPDGTFINRGDTGIQGKGDFTLSEKVYAKPAPAPAAEANSPAPASAPIDMNQIMMMMFQQQMKAAEQQTAMLTALLTSMVKKDAPVPPDPVEQVTKLHALSAQMGGGAKNSVQELREMIELSREVGGLSASDVTDNERSLENIARIAEVAGDVLRDVFSKPPAATDVQVVVPRRQGGQLDKPPRADAQSQRGGAGTADMNALLKIRLAKFITDLARKAARGSDPVLYADLFLDSMSEIGIPLDQVQKLMMDPGLLDQLIAQLPAIAPHRAWFEQYLARVREGMNEDSDDADGVPENDKASPDETADDQSVAAS